MRKRGDTAPDFELPGVAAGSIDTHTLADDTDRGWTVVLTFYPFDFHPACVSQLCALRDAEWLTLLDDVVALGIGTDNVCSHHEFAEEYNLQFSLLSDSDGSVSEAYDVLLEAFDDHRRVPERASYVVGPRDREILYSWVASDFADEPDMDAIRRTATGDQVAADSDA